MAFLTLATLLSAVITQAADTVRYTVLSGGNPAGSQVSWTTPDGTRHYTFEYNDRGRGPAVTQQVTLDGAGVPTVLEISGHDYLKNAVSEHFSTTAGQVTWQNSAERGSRAVRTPAFYVSFDGVPEEMALLARALLTAPGNSLPLLPSGEARVERLGDLTVHAGGRSRTVVQYGISGLSFSPLPIWLDTDGEFFAWGSTWLMVIRQGWESAQRDLAGAQSTADSARTATLARRLAHWSPGSLVIRNADLFDAESGRVVPRTTVVLSRNHIVTVGPTDRTAGPPGAEVIDATGKTVIPGMWDMHVHTFDDAGLLHLAAGVTTVRDMGSDLDEMQVRRKRFDEGSLLGPRILMAGFIDGPGPYAGPIKAFAATDSEARSWVTRYADLGYVQIKIYSSVKPELVPVIVNAAHQRGLRVSGHVPAFMVAEQAVRLGFDEIQHANFFFLNFWGDSIRDTRTPGRFTVVAERGALLDLQSAPVRAFLQLLRERGTALDPTVNVFEGMYTARQGTIAPGYVAVAEKLPAQIRRGFLAGGLPVPAGMDQRYRDSFAAMLRLVKMAFDAGIPIEAGTDGFPGFAFHRELELYAQAGIPAPEILRIATFNAARIMHRDGDLGSVAPGKLADLIVVDGHPAEQISDLRRVSLVIKDGIMYRPAEMYQAIGVTP